ncbi:hypothetical protein [Microvirga roseola]|uniref:hypothetical protein n=1 Tax=Microvirga roseola TaxID=2883126 RepID=UPI001E59C085|nr:hypothetical protein [Microvirga roseola]
MSARSEHSKEPVTEERLVRAVEALGEIMKEHGPKFGPLYESLEQELTAFRQLHNRSAKRAEAPVEAPARKRA